MQKDDSAFQELVERLQQGDQEAAAELVQQHEPEVRRFIRFRLSSPSLKRLVDSVDISQSVFARFFVQVESGGIDFQNPDQLRRLLLTMARNRLYDQARKHHAIKRDGRRVEPDSPAAIEHVADGEQTPSQHICAQEIVEAVRQNLSDEELHLVDERLGGRDWESLAIELKSTSEAVRKRMTRAIDRAARDSGVI